MAELSEFTGIPARHQGSIIVSGSMTSDAVVVLKGRGGVFRLGKSGIVVSRGGLSKRVPLSALTGHTTTGRVVELTTAEETYTVEGRNEAAVAAFTDALNKAMRKVEHDPDATVTAADRPRQRRSPLTRLVISVGVFAVLLTLWGGLVVGVGITVYLVVLGLVGWGGVKCAHGAREMLRDHWTLRQRGVTVQGEITEYSGSSSSHIKYPHLRFTTATGRSMSVNSLFMVLVRRPLGPADVTYDPKNPKTAKAQPAVFQFLIGAGCAFFSCVFLLTPVAGVGWLIYKIVEVYQTVR